MTKKTILVVEDEHPLVKAIQMRLEKNNFNVLTARTVEQAIAYLEDVKEIDALWLDHYLLGKVTGLDLVKTLKEEGSVWKNIPVFIVSNTASKDNIQSFLHLGVDNYYIKSEKRLDGIVSDIKSFLAGNNLS